MGCLSFLRESSFIGSIPFKAMKPSSWAAGVHHKGLPYGGAAAAAAAWGSGQHGVAPDSVPRSPGHRWLLWAASWSP